MLTPGNPAVLLIDEFSTGVDVQMKREMWQTLRNVAGGKAVIITTRKLTHGAALIMITANNWLRFYGGGNSSRKQNWHHSKKHAWCVDLCCSLFLLFSTNTYHIV